MLLSLVITQVTTVDRYQGQQNDYIILSLVRTKHVGHLRDVRRLVVAMSRARLGLYVLARVGLFQSCTELQPAFTLVGTHLMCCHALCLLAYYMYLIITSQMMRSPLQLHLIPGEFYPTTRPVSHVHVHVNGTEYIIVLQFVHTLYM